ncbi:(d)CMP kinase [Pseudobacteroides cellulosolvens]|uniref:Cytidylate kinase n=1 Tax=Pseudobacteroides cellulosolvens ATCC 35603 = DSM 2933 TaxID=398512 RepID=A0A0L6JKC9_9FIRM|nr:(d)CMP kinase [Pseudobacteroides cellulosolvens]KNY26200.1 Cytidylate kinase [Pseudobacteroides cellulosolvens ATCC 35603 = DSM 2933]
MQKKISIAIDGPAGAGKSTIAKMISKEMGIVYLDTGAMYRTVALKAIRDQINTTDRDSLSKMVDSIDIAVNYIDGEQFICLNGEDVTSKIRTPEISIGASNVAVVPEVRIKMVELQRQIASKTSVIMDGRDIGTYVLPDAQYKFFLTASVEERALRRYNEQIAKGYKDISLDNVKNDIEYRDKNDSSREFAPLSKAADAIEIDTTSLSIDEVAQRIINIIRKEM